MDWFSGFVHKRTQTAMTIYYKLTIKGLTEGLTQVLPCYPIVMDSTSAAMFLNIITGRGLTISSIKSDVS